MVALTVREFCNQAFRLINPSNPTQPLVGDDQIMAIRVLNQVLRSYAGTGLMITIAKTVVATVNAPVKEIFFTGPDYPTTEEIIEQVTLTNLSPVFTVADSTKYFVGDIVTGNGLPPFTSILAIAGNNITVSANATFTGLSALTFVHSTADPNVTYIKEGRLSNLDNAWLVLNGVTYPLIDKSRNDFLAAWKYGPLTGLPRFIITYPEANIVRAQLYPAPSNFYQFYARGKFQLSGLTVNDTLDSLPGYYELYLLYAIAKYLSKFKGRGSAWTPDLESDYRELKDNIEAASEVNLAITGDAASMLNGAWRVRAGI